MHTEEQLVIPTMIQDLENEGNIYDPEEDRKFDQGQTKATEGNNGVCAGIATAWLGAVDKDERITLLNLVESGRVPTIEKVHVLQDLSNSLVDTNNREHHDVEIGKIINCHDKIVQRWDVDCKHLDKDRYKWLYEKILGHGCQKGLILIEPDEGVGHALAYIVEGRRIKLLDPNHGVTADREPYEKLIRATQVAMQDTLEPKTFFKYVKSMFKKTKPGCQVYASCYRKCDVEL